MQPLSLQLLLLILASLQPLVLCQSVLTIGTVCSLTGEFAEWSEAQKGIY